MPTKLRFAALCALAVSCTFGGGEGDPTDGFKPMDGGAPMDAASPMDAAPMDAARSDAAPRDSAVAIDASPPPEMCTPAVAPEVCDPVKNTGCPPLTQCEIDPEATTPAGRCVFWMLQLGLTCAADGLNTTCDAPNSCVGALCRKPCYCNDDCGDAGVCTGTAPGPSGPIKLCEPG